MKSDPGSLPTTKTGRDLFLIFILVVFFLGLLPPAASFVFYAEFPDQHYTDAAIPMFRNNTLLTPRQRDGTTRLVKPPLTYWLMVGGYRVLGVGPFSSRLVFLLSGCAIIWVGYALAFKLTGDIKAARMAALVLLSHPLITSMSIRTLPDILLALWILISGYGFIRLICLNDVQPISYWTAYGGAALAAETKGLLALLFVGYALAFAFVTSSPAHPFRRMFNIKIMLVALLIACSGFILMFWKHGEIFLQTFWADQVGQKVDFKISYFLFRTAGFVLIFFLTFLPWLICRGYFFFTRKSGRPATAPQRRSYFLIGGWALLLSISFSLGKLLSAGMIMRYMLPAVPLLGVIIALELYRFSESDLALVLNPLRFIAMLCFFAVAIFGLRLLQETGFTNYFALAAILLLVILFVILQQRKDQLSLPACFSISCFLFWPLVFSIASPFKLPDESVTITRELRTTLPPNSALTVIGEVALGSRINMVSRGDYVIYQFRQLSDEVMADPHAVLIVSQSDAEKLPPNTFQLREIGSGLRRLAWGKFITATLAGTAKPYLDTQRELYYAATPVPKEK